MGTTKFPGRPASLSLWFPVLSPVGSGLSRGASYHTVMWRNGNRGSPMPAEQCGDSLGLCGLQGRVDRAVLVIVRPAQGRLAQRD